MGYVLLAKGTVCIRLITSHYASYTFQLAAIALDGSSSFKKQLRVQFDGEHAVDEGGVSKEFYQLITEKLFCPDYGLFFSSSKKWSCCRFELVQKVILII